jgi:hypothetical protein
MKMIGWQVATWHTLSSIITVTRVFVCVCVCMCVCVCGDHSLCTQTSASRTRESEGFIYKCGMNIMLCGPHLCRSFSYWNVRFNRSSIYPTRILTTWSIRKPKNQDRQRERGLFNDAELLCHDYITSVVRSQHSEKILTHCHSVNHKSHMDGPGIDDCVSPETRSIRPHCLNCTVSSFPRALEEYFQMEHLLGQVCTNFPEI